MGEEPFASRKHDVQAKRRRASGALLEGRWVLPRALPRLLQGAQASWLLAPLLSQMRVCVGSAGCGPKGGRLWGDGSRRARPSLRFSYPCMQLLYTVAIAALPRCPMKLCKPRSPGTHGLHRFYSAAIADDRTHPHELHAMSRKATAHGHEAQPLPCMGERQRRQARVCSWSCCQTMQALLNDSSMCSLDVNKITQAALRWHGG